MWIIYYIWIHQWYIYICDQENDNTMGNDHGDIMDFFTGIKMVSWNSTSNVTQYRGT
jgi:hypothetical protein